RVRLPLDLLHHVRFKVHSRPYNRRRRPETVISLRLQIYKLKRYIAPERAIENTSWRSGRKNSA
ncbi:MAG: hypothetical protein ACFFCW_30550, partial [Candidatus Hodarchaeota archaeon]